MHDGISVHFSVGESKYAAEGVNWPMTMASLAEKYCRNGPSGDMLEINSHGHAGTICLMPFVGFKQLDQFAILVRKLIKPGGGIEVLSCVVAAFNTDGLKNYLNPILLPDHISAANQYKADRRQIVQSQEQGTEIKTNLDGKQIISVVTDAINSNREFLIPQNETMSAEPSTNSDDYRCYANGPLFCSRLAVKTMTTVRAAMVPQVEEGEKSGNQHYSTPIGNWEGHVLDFLPGGGVRYAGFNLPRPVFRTHDQHGDGPIRFS